MYIASKVLRELGCIMGSLERTDLLIVVRPKMTSESRVCLALVNVKR